MNSSRPTSSIEKNKKTKNNYENLNMEYFYNHMNNNSYNGIVDNLLNNSGFLAKINSKKNKNNVLNL